MLYLGYLNSDNEMTWNKKLMSVMTTMKLLGCCKAPSGSAKEKYLLSLLGMAFVTPTPQ